MKLRQGNEMKKTVIGAIIFLAGVVQTIGVFLCGILYLPHVTAWNTAYPSKLFFLIMSGNSQFSDGADGLGLGIFFVFGIAMVLFGLGILICELAKKDKPKNL